MEKQAMNEAISQLKNGHYSDALVNFAVALKSTDEDKNKAIIHRLMAQCFFHQHKYIVTVWEATLCEYSIEHCVFC